MAADAPRNRVRQMDRKDQTTPLIGNGDHCLRSPKKFQIFRGPGNASRVYARDP